MLEAKFKRGLVNAYKKSIFSDDAKIRRLKIHYNRCAVMIAIACGAMLYL
jgi:hypothetical protein